MPDDDLRSLAESLQSSLNTIEHLLARFSQSLRRHIVSEAAKGPAPKVENVMLLTEMTGKLQSEFAKYKATLDLVIALFAE